MVTCRRCGERLRQTDLRRVGRGYVCRSSLVCRWRRRRNFEARQLAFNF